MCSHDVSVAGTESIVRATWPDCSLLLPEGDEVVRGLHACHVGFELIGGLGWCSEEITEEIICQGLLGRWRKRIIGFNI